MRILRDVVRVSGPDAVSFLQGQLSQDVEGLAAGASAWSLILQPQGKVDAWVRVTREADDAFVIDVDTGYGDAVVARLDRFKLRVKAALSPAEPRSYEVDDDTGVPRPASGEPDDGWREHWDRRRVELGIPAMGRELTEDTIPEEAGLVDASASFTKGCYTGQELVARIDSRGRNVPRRLRRVTLIETDGALADGDQLSVGEKAVGTVTTAAGREALAYVGRAVEVGATVSTPAGVARIDALPPLR